MDGVAPPPLPTCSGFDQVEVSGAWPIKQNCNVFAAGGVFAARPDGTGAFRRLRVPFVLLAGAPGGPPLRQQPQWQPGHRVWLQLELAGLAGVGSASDAFLTEEIRGYVPAEARNPQNQGALKTIW